MNLNDMPTQAPKRLLSRRVMTGFGLAVAACVLSGCNYFILLDYLLGGPPSIEPPFDADGDELPDTF